MSNTTHTLNAPQTATKVPKILKKRGRKGNKISTAFENIPAAAVDFEGFANRAGVSTNVLKQIKRHDTFKASGKVFIRKDKKTGRSMIWREPPATT